MSVFFLSDWCYQLTGGVDGNEIIKAVKMQAEYDRWRRKNCTKCNINNCIHNDGKHYTAVEKNELVCKRESKN